MGDLQSPCEIQNWKNEEWLLKLECPIQFGERAMLGADPDSGLPHFLPILTLGILHSFRSFTNQSFMELPVISLGQPAPTNEAAETPGCGTTPLFEPSRRLPAWLKREVPKGNENRFTSGLLDELRLETVCENAKCPNRMECYSQKTATFMILGNVCTRPCGSAP